MAHSTDQQRLAKFFYSTVRPKGAPKWESLIADDRQWWLDLASMALARAVTIAERPPLVGRTANPKE